MSKPIKVAAMWDDFRARVVPADAGAEQVRDMRMAFYVGAYDLFRALVGALDEGQEATEADLRVLDDLKEELEAALRAWADMPAGPGP